MTDIECLGKYILKGYDWTILAPGHPTFTFVSVRSWSPALCTAKGTLVTVMPLLGHMLSVHFCGQ